jgi:hypothetical protein
VIAALLAADTRAWRSALDRGDTVYAVSPRAAICGCRDGFGGGQTATAKPTCLRRFKQLRSLHQLLGTAYV